MADDQNVQTPDIQNQNTVVTSTANLEQTTPVQTDIAKIEAAIQTLFAAGEELFADEIAALKQKRDALIAEAQAVATELTTVEQSFIQKYGSGTAHGIEIILLAVILCKLFGVLLK
jgi:hypothetical protein